MPGRKYSAGSGYRYGFNGKENDKDISKGGQDYGMRVYDTRLGRFLSVDPFAKQFQSSTPYNFAGNSPISLIDYEGGFRISPYFVKKYPTLAKLLSSMAGYLKSDTKARDSWIYEMGIKDVKVGQKLWDEMLTFGSGPWVTPDRPYSEMKDISLSSFFANGNKGEFVNSFPDNIIINRFDLNQVEAALKQSDGKETSFQIFKAFVLVIHEAGHWARFHAGLQDRMDYCLEDGAQAEFGIFGKKFCYAHCRVADLNLQIFDEVIARKYFNGNYNSKSATNEGIVIPKLPICLDMDRLKKMPTPKGQKGDPAVVGNGDEPKPKPGTIYTPKAKTKGKSDYAYDY